LTPPGLRFSERMRGFLSPLAEGFDAAWAQGRADGSPVEYVVSIEFDDLTLVLNDLSSPAALSGTVVAPRLSPQRLTIRNGTFTLMKRDPNRVETFRMLYDMHLLAEDGRRFRFEGFKLLHDGPGLDAWPDTSTLYVTVRDESGPVAMGIMRITPSDFLRLLQTFKVVDTPNLLVRWGYKIAFGGKFARSLLSIYGGRLDQPKRFPRAQCEPRPAPRSERLRDPVVRWYDGVVWHEGDQLGSNASLRLTRYQGGSKGPVVLAPGFGMSAHSYALDTTETNLTRFLFGHDYDVWLFDYRAGIDLPSSCSDFTIDDIATQDWPTAVAEVRRVTGAASVQALGHCVGSVSLLMAMLAGMTGIRSAVCANFTTHIVSSSLNLIKAHLHIGEALDWLGLKLIDPEAGPDALDSALDAMLRALPVPEDERCRQAVCRWVNGVYGCTHRHAQLDDETHRSLNDMFGVGNLKSLRHLATMTRAGKAVDHHGCNIYLPWVERLAVPILLLHGRHNYIFDLEGSRQTFDWLCDNNGEDLYTRVVLPDYSHLDAFIGRNAAHDVYPVILHHLERTSVATSAAQTSNDSEPVAD
jgi:choline dehydrogenase-like flavoprotein